MGCQPSRLVGCEEHSTLACDQSMMAQRNEMFQGQHPNTLSASVYDPPPASESTSSLTSASEEAIITIKSENQHTALSSKKKDTVAFIRSKVIGARALITTPFGVRELVYADYTASGRCLSFIEEYMVNVVAPMYANTHTEASTTGAQTTRLREEAREIVSRALNAPMDEYAVLFTGTGATGAIDKLVRILGLSLPEYAEKKWNLSTIIPDKERPIVFISPFEHHSNELVWRESVANVVVIDEDKNGMPDLKQLERELIKYKDRSVPLIGSFSAGSNVTGLMSDTRAIASLLHKYGAYAFFDFAGVAPYVDIDVYRGGTDEAMDAVFLSPHKFIGGPGASGILVARRNFFSGAFGIELSMPTMPGGGTVAFVSKDCQTYEGSVELREDAGTPGIPQCIRAGLVFKVKEQVGAGSIRSLETSHGRMALEAWRGHPSIVLMGCDRGAYFDYSKRVPIVSFLVLSPVAAGNGSDRGAFTPLSVPPNPLAHTTRTALAGACCKLTSVSSGCNNGPRLPLHPNFIVALLNDLYGIQGRGGCSCAGPYGFRLFGGENGVGKQITDQVHRLASMGYVAFKPGWARVNLNFFISDDEVHFIVEAINQIATHGWKLLPLYVQDLHSGQFIHRSQVGKSQCHFSLDDIVLEEDDDRSVHIAYQAPRLLSGERTKDDFDRVLSQAMDVYARVVEFCHAKKRYFGHISDFTTSFPSKEATIDDIWWLRPTEAMYELEKKKLWKHAARDGHHVRTEMKGLDDSIIPSMADTDATRSRPLVRKSSSMLRVVQKMRS